MPSCSAASSTELASTYILPRLVGIARASDLLLTGRIFLGEEAAQLGVVNEARERDQVLPRAREIARYIVEKCAPASVALTKRLIWEHLGFDDPLAVSEREARVAGAPRPPARCGRGRHVLRSEAQARVEDEAQRRAGDRLKKRASPQGVYQMGEVQARSWMTGW